MLRGGVDGLRMMYSGFGRSDEQPPPHKKARRRPAPKNPTAMPPKQMKNSLVAFRPLLQDPACAPIAAAEPKRRTEQPLQSLHEDREPGSGGASFPQQSDKFQKP